MTVVDEHVHVLAAEFSGALLKPGDEGYDDARQLHNGLIDKRPALIARCRSAADVARAIAFARDVGLEIAVRGGGHNVAGRACTDGGVMVDLAEMKEIEVDPEARTLRAQGGVVWGELNNAAAEHGLAVTGGAISTTGVAGYTLGGGLGWLMGLYGLAVDNLAAVELVTASGEILEISESSYPDLFWAIRGGGGNFGVATAFEFRMHPLETVVGGLIAHPFDAAQDLLRFYREFTASSPDALTVYGVLAHAPDGSGVKIAAMGMCHAGSPEDAERDLAPIRGFGSPVMEMIGPMPYPAVNTMLDEGYPRGALSYWKSSFVDELSDSFIDEATARFAETPSPMNAILIEHYHGSAARVGVTETAVPHREPGYNVLLPSTWLDPTMTDANIAWTRETYDALRPYFRDGRWLNYFSDDDGTDAVRAAYGPNFERLVEVKRRYDPENVFHLNHNIKPG